MTFAQFFFANNVVIINSGLLKSKIWIDQLIGLLKNSRIHIEFHCNFFYSTTKRGLKNEIMKLNVNFILGETLIKW